MRRRWKRMLEMSLADQAGEGEADVGGDPEHLLARPAHHHASPADPFLGGEDDTVPADEADGGGTLKTLVAHLTLTFHHDIREARY